MAEMFREREGWMTGRSSARKSEDFIGKERKKESVEEGVVLV